MTAMNGITNELLQKRANRKWKTRCGAFLLAVVAAWNGAYPGTAMGDIRTTNSLNVQNPWNLPDGTPAGQARLVGDNNADCTLNGLSGYTRVSNFTGTSPTGNGVNGRFTNGSASTNLTIDGGNTLYFDGNGMELSGSISNDGNIVLAGRNTTSLTINSTFNNGGTLTLNTNATLTQEGSFSGGALQLFGDSVMNVNTSTFNPASIEARHNANAGILQFNNTGGLTFSSDITGSLLRVGVSGGRIAHNGTISDSTYLLKQGTGRFALNGTGGNATKKITQGTLSFGSNANLGDGRVIFDGSDARLQYSTVDGGSAGNITLNNNFYVENGNGIFHIVSNGVGNDNYSSGSYDAQMGATTVTYTGTLSSQWRNSTFTKTGLGRMIIESANAGLTGTFEIQNGAVIMRHADSIGANASDYTVHLNDMTGSSVPVLAFNIFSPDPDDPTQQAQGTVSTRFLRNIQLTGMELNRQLLPDSANDGYVTIPGIGVYDNNEVTLAGYIHGNGALNKSGGGTLIIEKHINNNYSGSTTIIDGVLSIGDARALGTNASVFIGGFYQKTDPILRITESITLSKNLYFNQLNSAVEVTGDNTVTLDGSIANSVNAYVSGGYYTGNFHKLGSGTLLLTGLANEFHGETYICEGTIGVASAANLNANTIHLGCNSHPGASDQTRTLRAYDTLSLVNNIVLEGAEGNQIEVDDTKRLTLSGRISQGNTAAGFTKTGLGELVLTSSTNSYTGMTTVGAGTLTAGAKDVIASSAKLTMDVDTVFDMTGVGFDQKIGDLSSAAVSAKVLIGNNTLTLNTVSATSDFKGNVIGDGTIVKAGNPNTVQTVGLTGFTGKLDVQVGILQLNTDAAISGLTGKSGTELDIRDKTLAITTDQNYIYEGRIASYSPNVGEGRLVKDGLGTLTTSLVAPRGSGGKSFQGSIEMKGGHLNVTSDLNMVNGSQKNSLTFHVSDISWNNYSVINVLGSSGTGGTATFGTGTQLNVIMNDTVGWQLSQGEHIVGLVKGDVNSKYSEYTNEDLEKNLGSGDLTLTPNSSNSLFYQVGKRIEEGTNYKNMKVVIDVTGFRGVGSNYNQSRVGANLDVIRTTPNIPSGMTELIKQLWAYGNTDITDVNYAPKRAVVNNVLSEISGDTMANAMFLGLSRPWKSPFARLNLDSQMMYAPAGYYRQTPREAYRGQQPIMNMSRVWINPFTTSMDVQTDDNARSYGISRQGFMMGYDRRIAQNASAGLVFGYSTPYLYQDDDRVRAADFQIGAYAGAMIGYFFELKGYIGYGHQNYESTRIVDLTGIGLGLSDQRLAADGRFTGDTFAFSLELARPLFFGFCVLRPTLGLDSEHVFRGNFCERGDYIAQSFRNSDYHMTTGRFGASVETSTFDRVKFNGRMFYGFQLGGNDYAISQGQFHNIPAIPGQTIRGVGIGTSYFDVGLGAQVYVNPAKTMMLFGDYDSSLTDNMCLNHVSLGFSFVY